MIRDVPKKMYGNCVVLANLPGQRNFPYLPQEELWGLRDARLRRIVRYAAETVPYYRRLFHAERVDAREIRSVEDLDRLPLIDKHMVRKDPDLFVSTSHWGGSPIPFLTSGSTGTRLRVCHDPYSLLANIAFGERERQVVARICGRVLVYKELYLLYSGSTITKVWDFYRQWTFLPVRPQRLLLSVSEPVERIINTVNRFHPDVITGYGSYLEALFRIVALRGIRIHPPRVLIYAADSMTPEGRGFIEQEFGVPVLSQYNAVECFKIGFFCEERRSFHLHEDLCHVKIVNPRGQKVASGKKGEVVISNLVNRGTVLLNYRLGDVASMSSERCGCGRTLMLLSELEGRVEDIVFLPNGEFVHPRAIWGLFKGRNEVLRYQLIQHSPARFELKLLTVDSQTYQRVIGGILADLRDLLGRSAVIHSRFSEELEQLADGKFRPVISLCGQGGLG